MLLWIFCAFLSCSLKSTWTQSCFGFLQRRDARHNIWNQIQFLKSRICKHWSWSAHPNVFVQTYSKVVFSSLFAQYCNLIPSKLDLQLEALRSLIAAQQWEAMPLCIWTKAEQHRGAGFRFGFQRWTLSVQKQYHPRSRRHYHWTFIYHKLLGTSVSLLSRKRRQAYI